MMLEIHMECNMPNSDIFLINYGFDYQVRTSVHGLLNHEHFLLQEGYHHLKHGPMIVLIELTEDLNHIRATQLSSFQASLDKISDLKEGLSNLNPRNTQEEHQLKDFYALSREAYQRIKTKTDNLKAFTKKIRETKEKVIADFCQALGEQHQENQSGLLEALQGNYGKNIVLDDILADLWSTDDLISFCQDRSIDIDQLPIKMENAMQDTDAFWELKNYIQAIQALGGQLQAVNLTELKKLLKELKKKRKATSSRLKTLREETNAIVGTYAQDIKDFNTLWKQIEHAIARIDISKMSTKAPDEKIKHGDKRFTIDNDLAMDPDQPIDSTLLK